MVREATLSDLRILSGKALFPLESWWDSSQILAQKTISLDGDVIASFFVKKAVEVAAIYHPDATKKEKLESSLNIIRYLEQDIQKLGYKDVYIFIKENPKFQKLLQKRVGMSEITDTVLLRRY